MCDYFRQLANFVRDFDIYERVDLAEKAVLLSHVWDAFTFFPTTGEPDMLYLGIDQHARQITISLRDENGDVLMARQVSTRPEKVNEFFQRLTRERLQSGESFMAVLEVCGFNDWLIRMLRDYRCYKVILIQPHDRSNRKTDRRDAAALSELLWINRSRLAEGKPVRGLRQIDIASTTDQ
ncbi:MAG: transposase, partial [Planctomycetales bacterium]|nr:transposase [Planctomycetales bacterium]